MGKVIERVEGIGSASIDYPYRLGQPLGEGKIVGVAESMDNEDREREGYQNDELSHSLSREGYHRS